MVRFAELRAGRIQEFFVVPRHGAAYALPEQGAPWTIRLRGREPGRYDHDRATRDTATEFAAADGSDFTVQVQAVVPDFGPGGTAYVEGYAETPVLVRVTAFVRVGALGMPGSIMNVLLHNEVRPEQLRQLAEGSDAPVGSVKLVPVHPPEE